MDGLLLPMILLTAGDKPNQKALLSQILPVLMPGPRDQKLAVAAFTARDRIRQQARDEQSIVLEAIEAGGFENAAAFEKYPAFTAAFKRLPPAVQATAFKRTPPPEEGAGRRGSEPT
ncbi:MAG TPA: hypothetical protein VF239_15735 [Vicinamibacterales bacterium]|jgi:hypothetical protein